MQELQKWDYMVLRSYGGVVMVVDGQEVAKMILDPDYDSVPLKSVVRFNRIQNRFMRVLYLAGIFRGLLIELILLLMNNRYIRTRVSNAFS